MPVSVATFRTDFPEFTDAPAEAVVQRCLDVSALATAGFPVESRDLAQEYYAAHLITQDPRGEPAAMRSFGGTGIIQQANVQQGNRFAKGTDQYLQAYLDLRAMFIIPILITG